MCYARYVAPLSTILEVVNGQTYELIPAWPALGGYLGNANQFRHHSPRLLSVSAEFKKSCIIVAPGKVSVEANTSSPGFCGRYRESPRIEAAQSHRRVCRNVIPNASAGLSRICGPWNSMERMFGSHGARVGRRYCELRNHSVQDTVQTSWAMIS